jgi:hypothetical protein
MTYIASALLARLHPGKLLGFPELCFLSIRVTLKKYTLRERTLDSRVNGRTPLTCGQRRKAVDSLLLASDVWAMRTHHPD